MVHRCNKSGDYCTIFFSDRTHISRSNDTLLGDTLKVTNDTLVGDTLKLTNDTLLGLTLKLTNDMF